MEIRGLLKRSFSLDLRSLALFRILIAVLILVDLALRLPDLTALYSDAGAWPRAGVSVFSVYVLWESPASQALLFALAGLLALGLLIGWRTRLMTIGSWLMLLSLQQRNVLVLNGGDDMLRIMLFWGCFLPLGARASVDGALEAAPAKQDSVCSIASAAALLQLAIVYWVAAILKSQADWRLDGTAVYYVLMSGWSTPFGEHLGRFFALTKFLSFSTPVLEFFGPFLLFLPFRTDTARLLAFAAFVVFHLGLSATLSLGLFPWVCCAAWTLALPDAFWRRLGESPATRFVEARLRAAVDGLPRRPPPAGPSRTLVGLTQSAAAAALVYVVLWNASSISRVTVEVPDAVYAAGEVLGLNRSWAFFSPVAHETVWWETKGTLADGTTVDAFRGNPRDDGRPRSASLRDRRWLTFLGHIEGEPRRRFPPYADYLCRDWNSRHGEARERLESVALFRKARESLPGYRRGPLETEEVAVSDCGKGKG